MNLFIYTGASRLNAAVVESATDLTPVSRLPDLIVGDSEPVTVKFLSASGAYESWSGGGTYTLSISIGALGGDGIAAYFQTSSFTTVTNGWTGRLNLASGSLPSVVAGYLAERPGAQSVPLFVQVRVTDADGNTETYARQAVSISGAVSVPTTANSTPVTYATAADVSADASTASAAAIAAAASASTAAGSASTAAGHVATAGNSATAAAASAVTAGNSATTASGHATTATTQATNAATSASSASTYKDAAAVSAASATSSAGTATTQAALATTNGAAQVTLAAAQVTLATTQATNAGTSASAAAVSAAAALVSEAAALVSKNAAAASAATASAVSGSGNGTFSAAALTGVNSITASASTALTLTGGSSGASLVLGATTSGAAVLSVANATTDQNAAIVGLQLKNTNATANNFAGVSNRDSANGYNGFSGFVNLVHSATNQQADYIISLANSFGTGLAEKVRIKNTGNLLIGTTTDMTGSGGLKIAGTTAATTTTSGALIVAGGGGFGGNLWATATADAGIQLFRSSSSSTIAKIAMDSSNDAGIIQLFASGVSKVTLRAVAGGTNVLALPLSITDSTPSTGSTSGALQVAGGIGVGGASVFGAGITTATASTFTGDSTNMGKWTVTADGPTVSCKASSAGGAVWNRFLNSAGTRRGYYGYASGSSADFTILNEEAGSLTIGTGSAANALAISSTGAATFAGAVTANGQLIAKGTATNDNAATGYIGEYPTPAVVLVGSAITLTTNTDANVTSISLTAGDWDVTGTAVFTGGAITGTRSTAGVSTVSATLNSSTPLLYAQSPSVPTVNADVTVSVPNVRISISSTTTVYLVSNSSFSAGTAKAYGCLQARRVR